MILRFEGVRKVYRTPAGEVSALRHADLTLQEGEFVAVTGPSGAGKSTLLSIAALLDTCSGGSAYFAGRDISKLDENALCALRKNEIGMIFQDYHLLPYRTALENVLFRFRYLPIPYREARRLSHAALARVGLTELASQPARLLSGGEMQRVAIARAIALHPALLVADEPTGNLDPATAAEVMRCFQALHADGMSILLVTHDPSLPARAIRRVECIDGSVYGAAA